MKIIMEFIYTVKKNWRENNMADYLLKAMSKSGTIRAFAAVSTETVNTAFAIQKPAVLSGIILGNVLTATALCGATLKGNRERISLMLRGNGIVEKAMAEAEADGKVRGYVGNSQAEFSADGGDAKMQINNAIGEASILTMTKDLGLKQPYSGTINCATGDIGADVAYYFAQSEQIPSAVAVSTIPANDGKSAEISGGYLVQQIPTDGGFGAQGELELDKIAETISSGLSLNSMLLKGFSPEKILETLFTGVEFEILEKVDLAFECSCNREALLSALSMFDEAAKEEILKSDGQIEIICELCRKKYYLSPREITEYLGIQIQQQEGN